MSLFLLNRYAKWRAAQLQNCLITGEKPPQPAPTPTNEEMTEADSFVPTHGNDYVDLLQIKTIEIEAMKQSLLAQTRPKVKDDDEDSFLDYVDASGTDEVFEPEIKTQVRKDCYLFIFPYLFDLFLYNIFLGRRVSWRGRAEYFKRSRAH